MILLDDFLPIQLQHDSSNQEATDELSASSTSKMNSETAMVAVESQDAVPRERNRSLLEVFDDSQSRYTIPFPLQ